jgi:hypothetical protein
MRRLNWLYDQSKPEAYPVYEVRKWPTRIIAYGLQDPDYIQVEVLVGEAPSGTPGVDYRWVPLARQGQYVRLTELHNHFMEAVPGYYRIDVSNVDPARLPDLSVLAVYDDASNDVKMEVLVEAAELACSRDVDA